MAEDGASSIAVTVRVRPFTIREAAQLTKCDDGPFFLGDGSLTAAPTPKLTQKGLRPVIKVIDDKCLVFDPPENDPVQKFTRSVVPSAGKRVKDRTFAFDRVFDENTTQGDVYEATTRGLLDSVLDGYNATVFAYGATGCGKTHTITGTSQQPGIIFLAMQELFERISERRADKDTDVSLSYLEIYNETIRDLLVSGGATSKGGLMLREDANQSVSVAGLSSHSPQNAQEVMDIIMKGNECRTVSPTEANATSSRSHAVLQINVSQRERNADVNEPHTMATLSIIDLAGSERASATKNRGERLLEGANINKSLLALGSCINALCDPRKKNHVPYRNSKLTRLLKFSLGGNCRTVMIVCVSPSSQHFDETQNTLRYANRAKNIQTKVTRNVFNVNRHVKDFLKKIDEQLGMINELKQQQRDYEATAFAKFRKQSEKKEVVAREGINRIRNAFEHSLPDRKDKMNHMRKLRHVERRIGMISAWMTAFDRICAAQEDGHALDNCLAMRKTAQGILVELEGSRQHYHQRIGKMNWERAMDSALQTGIRQLREVDGDSEESHIGNLTRETELLKAQAEREASMAVLEQDKIAETATVQVLLEAHFETVALVNNILHLDERGAVEAARMILNKILTSMLDAANYVIHPDGRGATAGGNDEAFPPSRMGTPKRRKPSQFGGMGGMSPVGSRSMIPEMAMPVAGGSSASHPGYGSPMRPTSPRKRKVALAKKTVSFTPKKKTPSKRVVRWRDDLENGTLTEFAKTPQRLDSTPVINHVSSDAVVGNNTVPSMGEYSVPMTATSINNNNDGSSSSSPIPARPIPSLDVVRNNINNNNTNTTKNSRFLTGFLSKKTDGSGSLPGSGTGSPIPPPPSMTPLPLSDSEQSPLRDLEPSKALNRTSLHQMSAISSSDDNTNTMTLGNNENGTNSSSNNPSSDIEQSIGGSGGVGGSNIKIQKSDAMAIKSALRRKRVSSISGTTITGSGGGVGGSGGGGLRTQHQRRRSPGRASSSSPPNGTSSLFTASHARRMVKGDKENLGQNSILTPRSTAVSKMGRRTTLGVGMGMGMGGVSEGRHSASGIHAGSGAGGLGGREAVRMSAVVGGVGGGRMRESSVGKGIWR
ncbi:MAG: hypothetical protein M1823_004787 [Watsoniomyces obsoletus]|nr:MAG: hypothetical protein M1823_004787 [Watsoniomyces obsoletus]